MKKILYLEDDFFIGDLYRRELLKAGFEVDLIANGDESLKKALENTYDLILLDVMVPGMDGITVCKEIKKNEKLKQVPVILMSNMADDSLVKNAKDSGALDYWVKDQILPHQLKDKVENLFYTLGKKEDSASNNT